jgi:choline dehydrogenase-like flavoprotein
MSNTKECRDMAMTAEGAGSRDPVTAGSTGHGGHDEGWVTSLPQGPFDLSGELGRWREIRNVVMPVDVIAGMDRGNAELAGSAVLDRVPRVGSRAPDLVLPDADGRPVSLARMLERGPVVVSFYRGIWCPFCNLELRAGPDIEHGYAITVSLMTPSSRGSLRLASTTPGAHPVIDPAYYTDRRDVDIVVAGLRIAREIGAAPALAPWRGMEAQPGPEVRGNGNLRSYVRSNIRSYSHYAGTCAIGTDERSVVGSSLHVHGIGNLRVADASVMPSPISANTNATVYAIAERAAELIRS